MIPLHEPQNFYFILSLVLGTLYPAYRSYKAIKNKDLREHVSLLVIIGM